MHPARGHPADTMDHRSASPDRYTCMSATQANAVPVRDALTRQLYRLSLWAWGLAWLTRLQTLYTVLGNESSMQEFHGQAARNLPPNLNADILPPMPVAG